MKSEKEILAEFGKKVIDECFDPTVGNLTSLRNKENPPEIFEDYSKLFKKLSDNDFNILKRYFKESMGNFLFDFLRIFEENEEWKIYFEEDHRKVNLVDTSEMLKAEPIIEQGWIERFSKE
jgi:hypothetical protein